jgi:hypothetical protein
MLAPGRRVFADPLPGALLERSRSAEPNQTVVISADRFGLKTVTDGLDHADLIGSIPGRSKSN